jgi:hypothetical protein
MSMKSLQIFFSKLAAVAAIGIAAGITTAQENESLQAFDWRVGDTWEYDYVINGKPMSETWTVTKIVDDRVTVTPSGKTFTHNVVFARDGQLFSSISPYTKERIDYESYYSLRLPVSPGKTWSSTATLNGENFSVTGDFQWRAIAWEKIRVTAGEFKAMRIDMNSRFKGTTKLGIAVNGTSTESRWYASQARSWIKWNGSDSLGRTISLELIRFSPGN